MLSGSNVGVIVFLSAVGLVVFAAVRAIWGLTRNTIELGASESWGRQLTSRRKKSGEEMSVLATASMAVTLFAAGIGVVVLLVYSF